MTELISLGGGVRGGGGRGGGTAGGGNFLFMEQYELRAEWPPFSALQGI